MDTIDNLPNSVHFDYARRKKLEEEMDRQYPLSRAFAIPSETQILNLSPEISAVAHLFGIPGTCQTPFASFLPPKDFFGQHTRNYSHEIIPSLKEFIQFAKQQPAHFTSSANSTPYESGELQNSTNASSLSSSHPSLVQKAVVQAIRVVKQLNDHLNFVRNNMARFLQG